MAHSAASPRVLPGVLIAAVGALLLLHNFGVYSLGGLRRLWPLLLVAFGLHMIFEQGARALGATLVAVGAFLQLRALGLIDVPWGSIWRFWPAALIVVGASQIARPARRDNVIGGVVLLTLGGYFLASNFRLVSFDLWELWPVAVIALGLSMVLRSLGR